METTMVEVKTIDDGVFDVRVSEGGGETRHRVTMDRKTQQELGAGDADPEGCIRAAFAFLLEREPKESILSEFDVTVISRYFPEFRKELPKYLKR